MPKKPETKSTPPPTRRPLGVVGESATARVASILSNSGPDYIPFPPERFQNLDASYTVQCEWVAWALGYKTEDLKPEDCPCPAAWNLRLWAMKNLTEFYRAWTNTVGRSDTRTDQRRQGSSEWFRAHISDISQVFDEIRAARAAYPEEPDGEYVVADLSVDPRRAKSETPTGA